MAGLALAAVLYARGVRRLWTRAGTGRGLPRQRVAAYLTGLLALGLALISPLDHLSDELLAAHMVQHLLLVLVAAPLLVVGAPFLPLLWSIQSTWRPGLVRRWRKARRLRAGWLLATQPLVAWTVHAAAIWVWHVPGLYQAALRSSAIHAAEHATFLGTGLLFWHATIPPLARRGTGAGVLALFAMGLQSGLLGLLLTFSGTVWYPDYRSTEAAWGLSPLQDQQLAGLIMWIPAGIAYSLAALLFFAAWLGEDERETQPPPRPRIDGRPPLLGEETRA